MTNRMQRALDGELSPHELTPAESAELSETRALLNSVVRAVPTAPLPDLGSQVLRRIEAVEHQSSLPPTRAGGLLDWLWSPRSVRLSVRPAYALAATAAIILTTMLATRGGDQPARPTAVAAAPQKILVQFQLDAPDALEVSLAGDFSDWTAAYPMTRSGSGVWTVVVPLAPGVHDYSFIVDGNRWVPDPAAPALDDGFGGANSRIAVLAPDGGRSL